MKRVIGASLALLLLASCSSDKKTVEGLTTALRDAGLLAESIETTEVSLNLLLVFTCADDAAAEKSGRALAGDAAKARAQEVRVGYACPDRLPAFRAGLGR